MENKYIDMAGMKILLVDDAVTNLDMLRIILEEKGFIISIAESGAVALKIASKLMPDLILLDVMMPGIDGFETCKKLKSDPTTKDIPIIFLSAKTDIKDVVQGFQVGGEDYITKPIECEEVLVRVKTQLQLRMKTKKLEEAQAKLERSNVDLQAFAYIVSHDLKAPLRNINHLGNFLKEDYGDLLDEKGRGYIRKIDKVATQMSQMIDGILQFSQIEIDAKPFESIDLKELIQRVIDILHVSIEEKKGIIHIGDLPMVSGDPLLLFQLFQNLIANALKFQSGEEPPVIKIHSQSTSNEYYEIFVEDNGIGFDEKYTEQIFDPLRRLVSKEEYKGSGIGLATCKKIVEHHKGTITCRSQPGKGSKFIISLPVNL